MSIQSSKIKKNVGRITYSVTDVDSSAMVKRRAQNRRIWGGVVLLAVTSLIIVVGL